MANKEHRPFPTEQRARPTILVVASDRKMLKLLDKALSIELECDVRSLSSGRGAVQIAEQVKPDLVIIDASLLDQRAVNLSDQLHRIKELASVPTLLINLLTPSWSTPQREHTIILRDPFVLVDFYAAVNQSLGRT